MTKETYPYLVWNPVHRVPEFQHSTVDSAANEAERLAKLHPGQTFLVMMAVGVAHVPPLAIYKSVHPAGDVMPF